MPLTRAHLDDGPPAAQQLKHDLICDRSFRKSYLAQDMKLTIAQKSGSDAASVAFIRPPCSAKCLSPHGKRTEACEQLHGAQWQIVGSGHSHATTSTTTAVMFLAGMDHCTVKNKCGHRFTLQFALDPSRKPGPGNASTGLVDLLTRDGPSEVMISIQPDSATWELINSHVERLAEKIENKKFLLDRSMGAAPNGQYGLYHNFEAQDLEALTKAIKQDRGRLHRFIRTNDLTPIYARCLLIDSCESAFAWHHDDAHSSISSDTIVCHVNWMLSDDYVSGNLSEVLITGREPPEPSRLSRVFEREAVKMRYLCGKDVFAVQYGSEMRGLRVWDLCGTKEDDWKRLAEG